MDNALFVHYIPYTEYIVYTYLSTYRSLWGPPTKVSISMFNVYMAACSKLPYILLFLIPQYGKSSP